jgi:hypothetical protein
LRVASCDIKEGAWFLPSDARLRPGPPTTSLAHDNGVKSLSSTCKVTYRLSVAGMLKSAGKFDVKKAFVFSSWFCQSTCVQIQDRDQRDTHIVIENSTTDAPASLQCSVKAATYDQYSGYKFIIVRDAHDHLAVDLACMYLPQP